MAKKIITAPLTHEKELYAQGCEFVAGIDEVGRGCFAGPVLACAVIMPKGLKIPGVTDSKKLTPQRRQELAELIKTQAAAYAFGWVSAEGIDAVGIRKATFEAMRLAYVGLSRKADAILIDGLGKAGDLGLSENSLCKFIVKGDSASHSIAAASIVAKVERDAFMAQMHETHSVYGFDKNKGYGTEPHRAAIQKYGACELHRKTFLKRMSGSIHF